MKSIQIKLILTYFIYICSISKLSFYQNYIFNKTIYIGIFVEILEYNNKNFRFCKKYIFLNLIKCVFQAECAKIC